MDRRPSIWRRPAVRGCGGFSPGKGRPARCPGRKDDTPLHAAAGRGNGKLLTSSLLDSLPVGPSALDLKDFDGNTVLHLAARAGRVETLRLLVAKGADLDVRNALGQTAFNLAEEGGFGEVEGLLAQKEADRSPQKFPALSGPYMGQTPPGAVRSSLPRGSSRGATACTARSPSRPTGAKRSGSRSRPIKNPG